MDQFFAFAPGAATAKWMLLAIVALLMAISVAFLWILLKASSSGVAVGTAGIDFRAPFYDRTLRFSELRVVDARVIADLNSAPERITRRTNGIGLPGMAVGWFRLQSGQSALAYVTRREQVVYVPTNGDYVLLFSVAEPDEFIAALRSRSN